MSVTYVLVTWVAVACVLVMWVSVACVLVTCGASNLSVSNVCASNVGVSNVGVSNVCASNVRASNVRASNVDVSNVGGSNVYTSNVGLSNVPCHIIRDVPCFESGLIPSFPGLCASDTVVPVGSWGVVHAAVTADSDSLLWMLVDMDNLAVDLYVNGDFIGKVRRLGNRDAADPVHLLFRLR